jgi:hypothetical protein
VCGLADGNHRAYPDGDYDKETAMAQATAQNQKKILSNQKSIVTNQSKILKNQQSILKNQRKILSNQSKILRK